MLKNYKTDAGEKRGPTKLMKKTMDFTNLSNDAASKKKEGKS